MMTSEAGNTNAEFDDPYFSRDGGFAESAHVFVRPSGILGLLGAGTACHVMELGFGTGLNLLVTLALAAEIPLQGTAILDWTSVEFRPLDVERMENMLSVFPEVLPLLPEFLSSYADRQKQGCWSSFALCPAPGAVTVRCALFESDVSGLDLGERPTIDAVFLDGHAPAKNPQMWSADVFRKIAERCKSGSTVQSWCSAGEVKRALRDQGFEVVRRQGFGRKRHRIEGRFLGKSAAIFFDRLGI